MPVNRSLYQMGNNVFHQHQSDTYFLPQQHMGPRNATLNNENLAN